jgi:hypothetical protein
MEVLGLLLALVALIAVPFVILGVAFKVLFTLLLLPLRIVGALVSGVLGLFAGLFGLAAGGVGLLLGLLVLIAIFVLLPLAPLILLAGVVWLAFKVLSPPVVRSA